MHDNGEWMTEGNGSRWEHERSRVVFQLQQTGEALDRLSSKVDDTREALSDKIEAQSDRFSREIAQIRTDIAILQVKSGIWGGIAGLVAAAGLLAVKLLTGK